MLDYKLKKVYKVLTFDFEYFSVIDDYKNLYTDEKLTAALEKESEADWEVCQIYQIHKEEPYGDFGLSTIKKPYLKVLLEKQKWKVTNEENEM